MTSPPHPSTSGITTETEANRMGDNRQHLLGRQVRHPVCDIQVHRIRLRWRHGAHGGEPQGPRVVAHDGRIPGELRRGGRQLRGWRAELVEAGRGGLLLHSVIAVFSSHRLLVMRHRMKSLFVKDVARAWSFSASARCPPRSTGQLLCR